VEPPLSLSAEQLLDTLRRECRAESGVWDWFDTLLRLEPDLVVEAAGAADLEDLSNAARAAVDRGSRLAIDEVTSRARYIAGEAGRPIASKIDVAAAVVQAARSTNEAAGRPLLTDDSPPFPHESAFVGTETKEPPTAGNTENLRPLTMSAAGLTDSLMGGKSERGLCELLVALVQGHPDAVARQGPGWTRRRWWRRPGRTSTQEMSGRPGAGPYWPPGPAPWLSIGEGRWPVRPRWRRPCWRGAGNC
jgi:hypothetical protein